MRGFLLDTDIVSFALRGHPRVAARLLAQSPSTIHVSAISLAELRYGAARIDSPGIHKTIDTFMRSVIVLPFDQAAADRFGTVACALARRGSPIGEFDTLIAAHALAARLTLVTNNTRHFTRVPGLRLEDWASGTG